MAQGRKAENEIPDKLYDEIVVERILKGGRPGRKPSRREAIVIMRHMHPARGTSVIAKAISRYGAEYDEILKAAFPDGSGECHTNTSANSGGPTMTAKSRNRSMNATTASHSSATGSGTKKSPTPMLALPINKITADTEILMIASGRVGDWLQIAENDAEREAAEHIRTALLAGAYDINFVERPELIRFARAMMGRLNDE